MLSLPVTTQPLQFRPFRKPTNKRTRSLTPITTPLFSFESLQVGQWQNLCRQGPRSLCGRSSVSLCLCVCGEGWKLHSKIGARCARIASDCLSPTRGLSFYFYRPEYFKHNSKLSTKRQRMDDACLKSCFFWLAVKLIVSNIASLFLSVQIFQVLFDSSTFTDFARLSQMRSVSRMPRTAKSPTGQNSNTTCSKRDDPNCSLESKRRITPTTTQRKSRKLKS